MRALKVMAFSILWAGTVALIVIWDQNTFSIVAAALGVAAVLMMALSLRGWRPLGASASALFVAGWAKTLVLADSGSPLALYWDGLRIAAASGAVLDRALVLGYEAALPLLHLLLALSLTVGMFRRRPAAAQSMR